METEYEPIRRFLNRVRARYRALSIFDAAVRAALAMSSLVAVALVFWSIAPLGGRSPLVLASVAGVVLVLIGGALVWGLMPLRNMPSDVQLARFIEERVPALDDRLATAVDVLVSDRNQSSSPLLREPLLEDAARRLNALDIDEVVPGRRLRRGGLQAGAATVVLLVLAFMAREPARQSLDAASLALFPERVRLEVLPGNTRMLQGAPLVIQARLVGNRAPVGARVEIGEGDVWRRAEMLADGGGRFRLSMASVASGFKYRVVAGSAASPTFDVIVAHPPRVVRIDAEYTYPAVLGLPPRTETDGGDVYAPVGTNVRLHIYTDRPMAEGRLSLANGQSIALAARSAAQLEATLNVVEDGSYRVALRDPEGLSDPGQTEYFIRTVEDRAPEVHIVKPASDRSVTRLEEVDIEAQADDDYGIERMELVYAVRGQAEKVIPLDLPARRSTSVTVHHTVYLEDLDVRPGDFVSYYVRARDVTRGSRSNEGRSDIFFLEIRPFEQEFSLAQSQSMAGSGHTGSIDDLVNAQKQIVVATWKLDRRGQNAKGAQSPADIRSVGRSEADLKERVEETASSLRESTMRDPRRRLGRGSEPADGPKVGQTMPEEDAMAAAVEAMGRAVGSLDALRTSAALPPEMQALNALLQAQALVKKRQVATQQSAQGGPGNNNRNYDISALFDKELRRQQETRYETRSSSAEPKGSNSEALEKIAELARRQDELLKRQQELARQQLTDAELARQLEKLTREQSEMRREAEDLTRQTSKPEAGQQNRAGSPSKSSSGGDQTARQLREISEDMRNAMGDLRRTGSGQKGTSASRALEKLKDLERQLRGGRQDQRKPGDLQLEAKTLADSERRMASELTAASGPDALRRLAAEQQRLADRARQLQNDAKPSAAAVKAPPRIAERMQQSAEALQRQAGRGGQVRQDGQDGRGGRDGQDKEMRMREAAAQQAIARDLDELADALGPAAPGGGESRAIAEQRERAQQLRENIERVTRELERVGRQDAGSNTAPSGQKAPGQTGKTEEGRQAGSGGRGEDLARLREQAARELEQTRELIDQLRRQDPTFASGGTGFTFEGMGMTFSSPGTEAFKQDFAKWETLRDQATHALERAESSLSKRLQQKESSDRLAAGIDDKAPAAYQQQVDRYFKALGNRRRP